MAVVAANGPPRERAHFDFGIGTASRANIRVNWPSGVVDLVKGVAANSTIQVVEGSGGPTPTATPTPSPPTITQQPHNRKVVAGRTATFQVTAIGSLPFSYQWRKNGADIPGGTSSSYTTPPTTLDDNGSRFSVVVSNTAGSVTSRDAKLAVVSGLAWETSNPGSKLALKRAHGIMPVGHERTGNEGASAFSFLLLSWLQEKPGEPLVYPPG